MSFLFGMLGSELTKDNSKPAKTSLSEAMGGQNQQSKTKPSLISAKKKPVRKLSDDLLQESLIKTKRRQ